MSKITDALAKLDPNNDNHWTSDGLPRIDTVKMLAADQSLTRESITAAFPEFTRQTALNALGQTPSSTPVEEVNNSTVSVELKDYAALQQIAQDELQSAISARDEAQALVQKKQNALDDIINERHAAGETENPMTAISGYLASQQKVLQERARRHKILAESGVTLNDIQALIPQRAPLDIALASKKK